jgi:MOSC domain-containing protein YiiM
VRFGNQEILRQFIDHGFPGTYVRILEEGEVQRNDELILVERSENTLTVKQLYELLFAKEKDLKIVKLAINNPSLPEYKRARLKKFFKFTK